MTNQQESPETIKKRYKKANSEYKKVILKKYGISDINRIDDILAPKSKEVKMTKTELSNVLMNHPAYKVKVSFQKQVKLQDIFNSVMNSYHSSTPIIFEKNLKHSLKIVLEGQERICEGKHNCKTDSFGRLYFTDDLTFWDKTKSYDTRMILISLNHLNWVEVNGVKYILK